MGFRIKLSLTVFLCIFSVFVFCEENSAVYVDEYHSSDFENLDWLPLYPEEILGISQSKIKFSAGFFIDNIYNDEPGALPGGVFFALKPEMHFLVFDGKFNVLLRSYSAKDNFFFDIANKEVSDYFESIRVKYRELTFLFGDSAVSDGELFYLPSTEYMRRYIGFDFGYSDWDFKMRSVDWKSWAAGINTPFLGNESINASLEGDIFLDNSASLTFAASVGPKISLFDFSITPLVGFIHQDNFSENYSELFRDYQNIEINDDVFTFGCKCGYDSEPFKFNLGLNFSRILEYFAYMELKPLSFSFGKRYNMSRSEEDIITWTKIAWLYSANSVNTKLGFGVNDSVLDGTSSFVFFECNRDFENGLGLSFSFTSGSNMELFLGIDYSFGLTDFYKDN